ncbi:hypothetical protein C0992_002917 [Termitomyces sp. T32_za158]|nr:hypothetical protein C0992_002917 [Termitomyces sp. T32_za158]
MSSQPARVAKWATDSWKGKPVAQLVAYPDEGHLNKVLSKISTLPPLVTPSEVRIGRIAGQYAKPRSSSHERVDNREVLSFRREFSQIIDALGDALDFSRTIGADANTTSYERGGARNALEEVDFYTRYASQLSPNCYFEYREHSHEGLMLDYEQALTRALPKPDSSKSESSMESDLNLQKAHYNTSAHFLWIGDRTRQITGAHVEYFRGIRNPIGIKVGPSMMGDELVRLLEIVNPDREPGRITLITRYGANKVDNTSPGFLRQ